MFRSVKPSRAIVHRTVAFYVFKSAGANKKAEPKWVLLFLSLIPTLDVTIQDITGQICLHLFSS